MKGFVSPTCPQLLSEETKSQGGMLSHSLPGRQAGLRAGRDWQGGQSLEAMGNRWYLGGCDGLQTRLPTVCKVTGDFNGVRGAAEVGVHPVGTFNRAGQGTYEPGKSLQGVLEDCTRDSWG